MIFLKQFKNKKVLITGHTGFKGAWLSLWLHILGAKVVGISKNIPTNPSHFKLMNLKNKLSHNILDIRNFLSLKKIILQEKPDFIFHLAAQALVKSSYKDPKMTWETNTIGTLNLLESLRSLKKNCIVILVTSDKSYKNIEIQRGYKENDLLGGYDPYSASKGATEFLIQSYVKSYFNRNKRIKIAVARAGNVIGGGDWSEDRIVPDCFKSWSKNRPVIIRNPHSTRPWQHVMEALSGYLTLAYNLKKYPNKFHGEVFNFGPTNRNNYSVKELLLFIKKKNKYANWVEKKTNHLYESKLLKLNSNKARKLLKWKNILSFNETLDLIVSWYNNFYFETNRKKKNIYEKTKSQIEFFQSKLQKKL